ncbi:hypothetical protein EAO68_00205 [Streptomyces sp. wa22]|nr:hypothetical protein EAO68_00205 [Streptomyces sp. wa22]
MYYGGWGHANVVELNPDMTSLGTFPDGSTYKEITPENYTEGSFMFKRDGTYYMMWSEGGWTGPDYSVSYAMSDSPTGPFRKIDRVLAQDPAVARGSGHNSILNVPGTDIWYIRTTDASFASGANGVHAGTRKPSQAGAPGAAEPVARFDNASVRSNVFTFESADAPNRFIRHAWSRGRVDADVTPYADMRWKVVPGLADPAAVSLESVNFPGTFLRQRDGEVWIDQRTDDAGFRADATWRRVPGLSDRSLVSFEFFGSPGLHLRHRDALLYVEEVTAADRPEATFRAW